MEGQGVPFSFCASGCIGYNHHGKWALPTADCSKETIPSHQMVKQRDPEAMKPDVNAIRSVCPEVDEALAVEHVSRLDDRYFEIFDARKICSHLTGLSGLSSEHPVEVLLQDLGESHVDCTVLGFDYPHLFSLLTGVLAGMGFNVLNGNVFTYEPTPPEEPSRPRNSRFPRPRRVRSRRKGRLSIIFLGRLIPRCPFRLGLGSSGPRSRRFCSNSITGARMP